MISQDSRWVQCPYCTESVELIVDPSTHGTWVEDCEVCCNPWQITASRDGEALHLSVQRAQ